VNGVFKNEVWWFKGDNKMEMIKGFKDLLGLPRSQGAINVT
jgi:hypothetical protein